MTDTRTAQDRAHHALVAELTSRWPEQRVAPGLARIQALTELLGDPQRACPVIQVAGTNGKGSTAAIIDGLLRSTGLRTGRFSSPHVSDVTERICIDGRPISRERFAEVWADVRPYVEMVDAMELDGVAMTFFEVITGMAYAAFADAPVDVMVIETGLGGTWDATNVAEAQVAVITPIDLDHTHLLGENLAEIAAEKAGIIKPGTQAILAGQQLPAAEVLLARCAEVGALAHREGVDFALLGRTVAVGGQQLRINASEGPIDEILLPLHGEHQAHNATLAIAATEAFLGMKALERDVINEGLADVQLPGRLEVVRTSPTIVLDGAHNPHGARAAAAAVTESFDLHPCIGVVASMADKDQRGVLEAWQDVFTTVVVTRATTDRSMPVKELAAIAAEVFTPGRVQVAQSMDDAIELAVQLADADDTGAGGVVVTGSVIAVGEARNLLVDADSEPEVSESDHLDDDGFMDFDADVRQRAAEGDSGDGAGADR
ncbi:bifunctional folylpolyglutamate synthase/dihydrofolate synthase [Propionibacteriaceae bacterium Y1685]|uniref:bifunctional folylpolyglutamate synthase/dihydrofolate synthase n=1 Tax=Microlunatus sp. Y1700 TaxID=3418487 RepID=UPI003B81E387